MALVSFGKFIKIMIPRPTGGEENSVFKETKSSNNNSYNPMHSHVWDLSSLDHTVVK